MNETSKSKEAEYKPIYCDHKKANGFSAYDLQSHSSGSGPNFMREFNYFVCLRCGEIKVSGKNLVEDKIQYFSEEFSIYHPDAVAAIVKNCNYMNTETDGYKPFTNDTAQSRITQLETEKAQAEGRVKELEKDVEVLQSRISGRPIDGWVSLEHAPRPYTGIYEVKDFDGKIHQVFYYDHDDTWECDFNIDAYRPEALNK